MTFPRPATPPLPPEDGEFARVKRAARLRRLRLPLAVGLTGMLSLALVLTNAGGPPQGSDRLITTPTTEGSPAPLPSTPASPSPLPPTPVPSPTALVAPTVHSTPSAQPSPTARFRLDQDCDTSSSAGPDITGVAVDETGRPLAGMTVTAGHCTPDGSYVAGRRETLTDSQGRFRIPCVNYWAVVAPYEWYSADRSSPAAVGFGWLTGPMSEEIPCGSTHRVVLPPAGTLELTVQDATGKPLAGRVVGLHMVEDVATAFVLLTSDAQGRASFTGLSPGRYFLYDGNAPYQYFDVAKGQVVGQTVVRRGSPTASPTPEPTPEPTPTAMTAPASG